MTDDKILFQDQTGVEGTSENDDSFGETSTTGDFNGDGSDGLAVSVRSEDIGNITNAGAVNVFPGSDNGLSTNNDQIWFQDQPGVEGTSEAFDDFSAGFTTGLSAGDFNGDGRDDLAIGVPFEDIKNIIDAGAVNILNGSVNGLTAKNSQIWFQDQPGIQGISEAGDLFGRTVAAGDFNGDGRDDLAIGVPFEDIKGVFFAGAVNILNGSDAGLTADDNQIWFQDQPGVQGTSEGFDNFGDSLVAGDFNGDGYDDLAIGVPNESIKDIGGAGGVNILNGSEDGLTANDSQIWFQDQPGVQGTSEASDSFGETLTAGDFNGDGFDDLAVGVFGEDVKDLNNAGAVNVFKGSEDGLTSKSNQIWFQDQPGVQGTSEAEDLFGFSQAAGDFNGDGFDDLAVGVFGEDVKGIAETGAINVFNGSSNGLTSESNQIWFQDQPGVEGTSEPFDRFGTSLSVGDFNGDGYDDLAIGVPGEDIGSIADAGAVNIIFGSTNGLMA